MTATMRESKNDAATSVISHRRLKLEGNPYFSTDLRSGQ
jgi:hypothetical protein